MLLKGKYKKLYHKLWARVGLELFQTKFNQTNIKSVTSTEHVLHRDSYNCGVFVCYFAKGICDGLHQVFELFGCYIRSLNHRLKRKYTFFRIKLNKIYWPSSRRYLIFQISSEPFLKIDV